MNKIILWTNAQYLIIGAIVVFVVLLCATLAVIFLRKKKPGQVKIDSIFITTLTELLGGKDNIVNVEVEQARLRILVKDLSLADLNGIKTLATQGVFVTGNYIKTLFKFESAKIASELKKLI